jgi:hypothetical protein
MSHFLFEHCTVLRSDTRFLDPGGVIKNFLSTLSARDKFLCICTGKFCVSQLRTSLISPHAIGLNLYLWYFGKLFYVLFMLHRGIALGYGLDYRGGSSPGRGWELFSSPPRPDRLWGPPSLPVGRYHGLFPWR